MATEDLEAEDIKRKVHDLAESMERVRSAQADRDDVVVDMKHAKISRLELLARDLSPVYNDLPSDLEQFEFAITNGETPRFWIDMTSFVRMGADGREYEFVKDTRLGRTILARSSERDEVGKVITDYVAERVLERERMMEGDWISQRTRYRKADHASVSEPQQHSGGWQGEEQTIMVQAAPSKERFPWGMIIVLGLIAGLFVLGYADRLEPVIDWFRDAGEGLLPSETGSPVDPVQPSDPEATQDNAS